MEQEKNPNEISFFRGKYAFLSNYYYSDIEYDGFTYTNVEAAFHAQKDLSRRGEFTSLAPNDAKKLGRSVKLREDWEDVKLSIMEELLRIKFSNPELKSKLLETGDKILIEGNYWHDTFWGVCRGKGENNLGKLLMKIRNEYINK